MLSMYLPAIPYRRMRTSFGRDVGCSCDQFIKAPYMIGDPRFHRWSHAQAGMHATEVIVREMQGQR